MKTTSGIRTAVNLQRTPTSDKHTKLSFSPYFLTYYRTCHSLKCYYRPMIIIPVVRLENVLTSQKQLLRKTWS